MRKRADSDIYSNPIESNEFNDIFVICWYLGNKKNIDQSVVTVIGHNSIPVASLLSAYQVAVSHFSRVREIHHSDAFTCFHKCFIQKLSIYMNVCFVPKADIQ